MKKKMLLVAGVIAAAAITSVSFAAGSQGTAQISVNAPGSTSFADVNAVDTNNTVSNYTTVGYYSANATPQKIVSPSLSPVANTVGSVSTGDLYTISPHASGNMLVTLYLTNAGALSLQYGYLNMNVNVYTGTSDGNGGYTWAASGVNTQVLSLNNGYVTFDFSTDSNKIYGVSVGGGSFYCSSGTRATGGSFSPAFFLTVQPSAS